ncbi:cytochrome P450 [Rhodococcus koreensis]
MSDAPAQPEATASIDSIPIFTEIDDPTFGQNWDWIGDDLFRREYQGLLRHDTLGVIVYGNADIFGLGTHDLVSHQAGLEGMEDTMYEYSTFTMRQPEHRAAKTLVARPVATVPVKKMAGLAAGIADAVINEVIDRGEIDLGADLVRPFIRRFWAEIFGATIDEISELQFYIEEILLAFQINPTEEGLARSAKASDGYIELATTVFERSIAAGDREIFTALMDDYEKMGDVGKPRNPATAFAVALLDAFNTAGALAANAIHMLVSSPEDHAAVRADRSLVSDAWLEASRLRPPVIATYRAPIQDIVHNGVVIPAETNLLFLWLFGNRDPEVFADPNKYILKRPNRGKQTNFGVGVYSCIGRHVAKMFGETIVHALTEPGVVVKPAGEVRYTIGSLVNEPVAMPVTVERFG